LLVFFLILGTAMLVNANNRVDVNSCMYGKNILLFYLTGLAGSFMIIGISRLFENLMNEAVATISYGMLFILAFHHFIDKALTGIALELNHFAESSPVLVLLPVATALLTLIVSALLIHLLIRFHPFLVGRQAKA
jgi:hypothetical protein